MYTGRLLNFDLLMKNGKFGGSIEKKKYIINTIVCHWRRYTVHRLYHVLQNYCLKDFKIYW